MNQGPMKKLAAAALALLLILALLAGIGAAENDPFLEAYQQANDLYQGADGDENKYKLAFQLLEPLAHAGYAPAQSHLGFMYLRGIATDQDENTAVEWFQVAAEQGDHYGQYWLARCYEEGLGTVQNPELAVTWYEHAAEQGYRYAMYNLGKMYRSGSIIPQDVKRPSGGSSRLLKTAIPKP